jgi:hypothetical protein
MQRSRQDSGQTLPPNLVAGDADGGRIAENILYFGRLLRASGLPVGPEKIVVTGKVIDSTNSAPIVGAIVSVAGRRGTTDSSGIYTLNDVAYSTTSTTGCGRR